MLLCYQVHSVDCHRSVNIIFLSFAIFLQIAPLKLFFSFVDLNYPRTTIYLNSEISVATLVVSKLSYESSASTTRSSLGSSLEEEHGADVDADDKGVSAQGSSESAQGDPGNAEGARGGLEEFRDEILSSRSSESAQDDAEGVCGP